MIENSSTIIFLAVLIISFLFSHFIHLNFKSISQFGGVEFVFFGILAGSNFGFGIINLDLMTRFIPVISLLIGLYGFLLGLEIIQVKRKSSEYRIGFFFFFWIFVFTTSVFMGASYFLLEENISNPIILMFNNMSFEFSRELLCLSIFLGGLASISSSNSINRIIKSAKVKSKLIDRFSGMAITGEVMFVIVAGIAMSALRGINYAANLGMTVVEWSLLSVVLGVACGLFFWFITSIDRTVQRTYLATIGIVILTTGVAHLIGFSPILLATICGLIVALTNERAEVIYEEVDGMRTHISILILFFSGVSVSQEITKIHLILAALYIFTRLLALVVVPFFTKHWLQVDLSTSLPGRMFCPHDILVVAFALDLTTKNFPYSSEILFCCLFAYLFFKFSSIYAVKVLLNVMWESRPRFTPEIQVEDRNQ